MDFEADYKYEADEYIWLKPSVHEHALLRRASGLRIIQAATGGVSLELESARALLRYTHLPEFMPGVAIKVTVDQVATLADSLEVAARDFSSEEMTIAQGAVKAIRQYLEYE